jgi:hypothetical protein
VRGALTTTCILVCASLAHGQTRPLLTEEATIVDARMALEIGGDFISREPNYETGRPRHRWDGPLLRLLYSPAESVEVDLEWVAFILVPADPDLGRVSDPGDVTLRTKLRLRDGGAHGPTLGARFTVTLPQTSFGQGLGPNTLRMSAQALVTQPVGPWRFHANAGVAIQDEVFRPHEQRDFLAYGLAAEWRVAGLTVVTEVAGLLGDGRPGTDARGEWRGGFRVGTGGLRGDAAVRRGLTDADGTWGATAGLSWSFPR